MSLDESLISYAVRRSTGLTELQRAGITQDDMVDEFRTVWRYILRVKNQHDAVPSEDTLVARFPDLRLPRIKQREIPILVADVKKRTRYIKFMTALNDVAHQASDYEEVDDHIALLMAELNTLHTADGQSSLVNLFDTDVTARLMEEIRRRRRGEAIGIPTGLKRLDEATGGLQKGKMYVVYSRTGIGKSWVNLLMLANAVLSGETFILYPLEMSLFDAAMRLYSIFSNIIQPNQANRWLKNTDLTGGKVSIKKIVKFLNALEDRLPGTLYVADVGAMESTYTIERIEAEQELYNTSGFWVDYLTLLKMPSGRRGEDVEGWQGVQQLSHGIKMIATRHNCVGGVSAQVNRQGMGDPNDHRIYLPRLEQIAYGDAIGQDTDVAIPLAKRKDFMYYALTKNRGGQEFGRTRARFDVNIGLIRDELEDEE